VFEREIFMTAALDLFSKNSLKTFIALGEPNRLKIVQLLRDGELTVGEIADHLHLRQPQASKHLKVLADNGILEVTAEANRRIYKIRPEPFLTLDQWLKTFKKNSEESFDKLDDYLIKLNKKNKKTEEK
jgi:DNA-binding transcriptional ArsR family regulator